MKNLIDKHLKKSIQGRTEKDSQQADLPRIHGTSVSNVVEADHRVHEKISSRQHENVLWGSAHNCRPGSFEVNDRFVMLTVHQVGPNGNVSQDPTAPSDFTLSVSPAVEFAGGIAAASPAVDNNHQ